MPPPPAEPPRLPALVRAALVLLASGALGLSLLLYVGGHFPAPIPEGAPAFDPSLYAHALRHVDARGRPDYAALALDRADLDAFVASLAAVSPTRCPERFSEPADALAYWLNAYNALTLQALVDGYPLGGVGGASGARLRLLRSWAVGGERLTLSALEERLSGFADARVFFALHTGARGGPGLLDSPYQAELIDAQLNEAGERFMGRPDAVKIQSPDVLLSPLLRAHADALMAALPSGRKGNLLQLVWAFLPDACQERPGCDTRAELDHACGARLDACAVRSLPFDWALDDGGQMP